MHKAGEIIGGIMLLLGMACLGAWLREEYPSPAIDLPQLSLGFSFLGFLLWSIGRSGAR
jgi:hypothetical protein